MNFKEWNIKKGLKRIWIVGSVFLFLFPFATNGRIFGTSTDNFYGPSTDMMELLSIVTYFVVSIGLWWGLLYLGFWIARGFVDDDDKKVGF